jgi:hypothetical protein
MSVRDQGFCGSHRMTDWAMTGEALAQAQGCPPGHFVGLLRQMREVQSTTIAEGDPVAVAITDWLLNAAKQAKPSADIPPYRSWKATGWSATILPSGTTVIMAKASAIRNGAQPYHPDRTGRAYFPSTDSAMTGAIARLQPTFRDIGVVATHVAVNGEKNRAWRFELPAEAPDPESTAVGVVPASQTPSTTSPTGGDA